MACFFARDLVSEPPNDLYPESFAERLQRSRDASASKWKSSTPPRWKSSAWARCLALAMGSVRAAASRHA